MSAAVSWVSFWDLGGAIRHVDALVGNRFDSLFAGMVGGHFLSHAVFHIVPIPTDSRLLLWFCQFQFHLGSMVQYYRAYLRLLLHSHSSWHTPLTDIHLSVIGCRQILGFSRMLETDIKVLVSIVIFVLQLYYHNGIPVRRPSGLLASQIVRS